MGRRAGAERRRRRRGKESGRPAAPPAPAPLGWLGAPPARPFHSSPRRALPSAPPRPSLPSPGPGTGPTEAARRPAVKGPAPAGTRREGGGREGGRGSAALSSGLRQRPPHEARCLLPAGLRWRLLLPGALGVALLFLLPWDPRPAAGCGWKGEREGSANEGAQLSRRHGQTGVEPAERAVPVHQTTFT